MKSRPQSSQKGTYSQAIKLVSSIHQSSHSQQQPRNSINNFQHHKLTEQITNQKNNKNLQLELQLREAQSHIGFLKQSNKQLLQKLSFYQRKCQDMRALEQELDFRRDQQKAMQVHLDNYQQMNNKLRERVALLEQQLKNRENIKKVSRTTCQESDCKQMSRQLSRKSYLNESNIESNRRSFGQAQKQNHPLTPKSRVSINFEKYPSKQIDSMHLIKQRRKVFL